MPKTAEPQHTRAYRAATPLDEEDIHPGAVLGNGRFEIIGIIGRGAMASVFRARDLRRNSDIALKVLARKYVGQASRERRFDNEARLGARLQGHRNVVAPLEAGRLDDCGGRMFLAMELVRGPTLSDLVAMHGPLSIEDACLYVRDIARALRDLHQGGVVHRDVKPENVIIVQTADGHVAKLLDFGLAADTGTGAEARQTRMGERPGTRHYMSPEQAWDAPAHPVFDIYALGVTFYELLTGHPPFFELGEAEVLARKCDLSLPNPTMEGKREGLPPRLAGLVDACLEPAAKKRLPSINAFLKRLDLITEKAGGGMKARTHQQTSMVGQARTIEPVRRKKSRLPELIAQAAAAKLERAALEAHHHVDGVVSHRARDPAAMAHAVARAAQPTAPNPQALPDPAAPVPAAPVPVAQPYATVPPLARSATQPAIPIPVAPIPVAPIPAAPFAPPFAAPAPAPRPIPVRRSNAGQRAILIGLLLGAFFSALLVMGIWLWIGNSVG